MKRAVVLMACCWFYCSCFCQQVFQLAPPLMKYTSVFFTKSMKVEVQFREPGAVIRYTLDETEPTVNSSVYTKPLIIQKNKTTITARSFSKRFSASATVAATFLQAGLPIKSITCTKPNEQYAGGGANALIDNKGGIPSLSSKTWLGFQKDTVDITVTLEQPAKINEVIINFLQDEGSWIFLPAMVAVYSFNKKINGFEPYHHEVLSFDTATPGSRCNYKSITTDHTTVSEKLLIRIVPLQHIPEWHEAKGQPAWVFIDEIKVY